MRHTKPADKRVDQLRTQPGQAAGERSAVKTNCRPSRDRASIVCSSSPSVALLPAKNCKSSINSRSHAAILAAEVGNAARVQGFEEVARELLGRQIDRVQPRMASLGGRPDSFEQMRLAHARGAMEHQGRHAAELCGYFFGAGGRQPIAGADDERFEIGKAAPSRKLLSWGCRGTAALVSKQASLSVAAPTCELGYHPHPGERRPHNRQPRPT